MRRLLFLLLLCFVPTSMSAQFHATHTPPRQVTEGLPAPDPLSPLDFLLGTWGAKTRAPDGSAVAAVSGSYSFHRDLAGHALERTSSEDTCKGPRGFDCTHHDRLTVFVDPNGAKGEHHSTLFALYLDSEGHVIYYVVSIPDPQTVVFSSQGQTGAPTFRLTYHLEGTGPKAVMTGKFQMAAPGSDDFHSYLEWSGVKL